MKGKINRVSVFVICLALVFVVLSLCLYALAFGPWLIGERGFTRPGDDNHRTFIPFLAFSRESYKSGAFPFMNFYQECGVDAWASYSCANDPFGLLQLLVPKSLFILGLFYGLLLKGAVYVFSQYLCLKIMTGKKGMLVAVCAVISGLPFALGPYMILQGGHFVAASIACLFPLSVVLMTRAAEGSRWASILLSFILTALAYTGHIQFFLYICMGLGAYLLFLTWNIYNTIESPDRVLISRPRRFFYLTVPVMLGALMSLALYLPVVFMLPLSERSPSLESDSVLITLLRLASPNVLGMMRGENSWFGPGLNYYEEFIGFCSVTSVCFFLAAFHVPGKKAFYWFWLILGAIFSIMCFGGPPRALFNVFFGFGNLNRAAFLMAIPLSLSLGYGLVIITSRENCTIRDLFLKYALRYGILLLIGISLLSIPEFIKLILMPYVVPTGVQISFMQRELHIAVSVLLFLIIGLFFFQKYSFNYPILFLACIALLLAGETTLHSGRIIRNNWPGDGPALKDAFRHPRTRLIAEQLKDLGAVSEKWRVLAPTLSASWSTYHQIEDIQSYNSMLNKYYSNLVVATNQLTPPKTGFAYVDQMGSMRYATFSSWQPSYSGMGVKYFCLPEEETKVMEPMANNLNVALYAQPEPADIRKENFLTTRWQELASTMTSTLTLKPNTAFSVFVNMDPSPTMEIKARCIGNKGNAPQKINLVIHDETGSELLYSASFSVEAKDENWKSWPIDVSTFSTNRKVVRIRIQNETKESGLPIELDLLRFGRLHDPALKHIAGPGQDRWSGVIFEDTDFRGKAYFKRNWRVVNDASSAIQSVFSLAEPQMDVILAEKPGAWCLPNGEATEEHVNLTQTPNRVTLDASTPVDQILVLAYTWYPGWRAFVNGKEYKTIRAQHAYMALPLKAGKHKIELEYVPFGLRQALPFSLAGLFGAFLWIFASKKSFTRFQSKNE